MQIFTTRSIRQLTIIGFVAVATLLIAALLMTARQLERLSEQSQTTVTMVATAMSASRQLVQQTIAMERNARQYAVLEDEEIYQLYLNRRVEYFSSLASIANLNVSVAVRQLIEELLTLESAAFARVADTEAELAFPELSGMAYRIATAIEQWISEQQGQLRQRSADTQRSLTLQALLFIVAAFALAAVFVLLITRPLQQIDRAINSIGSGEYTREIHVRGPQDLQALGSRLNWLRGRLAELEQQRTSFLRHVSHELKTPLASMQEGAALLNDGVVGKLSAEQREISQIIGSNCQRLQALIEELLRHNAQNFAVLSAMPKTVRVDRLIDGVVEAHQLALSSGEIGVETHLAKLQVTVDEERLRVVLDNLFTNAVKFTPQNGVIRLSLWAENGDAVFEISDQGPGIPEAERARIFEAFFQGSRQGKQIYAGSGLGLAIASDYATGIGARLELRDTEAGACFRVTLALAK